MDSLAGASAASSEPSPPLALPSKRRIVKIADDADEVLLKCRQLRDELRKKQMKQDAPSSDDDNDDDDEWGIDDDYSSKKKKSSGIGSLKSDDTTKKSSGDTKSKTKTQQLSLAELNRKKGASNDDGKQTIVEVVEMNSTEVMEGIENVAVKIAHQVLAKQGFQLDIPCEFLYFDILLFIALVCLAFVLFESDSIFALSKKL